MRRAIVLSLLLSLSQAAPAQDFVAAAFERVLAAILPKPDEVGWCSVPWHTELRSALLEAGDQQRPVLLWAMNGHPLGQT